ncbi:MAG TPA: TAXI family TRAP transporter solute-binding subunit [Xanthobacteraceae bacterium]|jgi:TRAP transporter TAXI family solute receptor
MGSKFVPAAVIASAIVAFAGGGSLLGWRTNAWNFSAGQTVRIATAPLNDGGKKFFAALKHEIAAQRSTIQLSLVETATLEASAQALKEQKADAAVIRSDDPAAAEGRTIFVLRNLYMGLLLPATSPIDSVAKLKGKKIGVVTKDGAIDPMAKVALEFYGIDQKHILPLALKDLAGALQHKQVAAVMAVGSTGAGAIADAVEIFRKSTKKPPDFLDLSEAKAIAERFAVYDEAEISVGAYGGSPAVPSEKVQTISSNLLLVSQPSLPNQVAGELTRLLLATKAKIATALPEAGQLSAPSTDNDELLPVHPGTIAFLNGTQSSPLDDPTNVILLCSMLFGFLGSLAAWVRALRKKTKGQEIQRQMRRLPVLLAELKSPNLERLDAIEQELEQLKEYLLEKFVADQISLDDFRNAEARVDHLSAEVQKQRDAAAEGGGQADEQQLLPETHPSPRLEIEDKGVLYRLPDRPRERPVVVEDLGHADPPLPARISISPPIAAA